MVRRLYGDWLLNSIKVVLIAVLTIMATARVASAFTIIGGGPAASGRAARVLHNTRVTLMTPATDRFHSGSRSTSSLLHGLGTKANHVCETTAVAAGAERTLTMGLGGYNCHPVNDRRVTLPTSKINMTRMTRRRIISLSSSAAASTSPSSISSDDAVAAVLKQSIVAAGDKIRDLKMTGADKIALQPHIAELLSLKKQWEELTGSPFDPPKGGSKGGSGSARKKGKQEGNKAKGKDDATASAAAGVATTSDKITSREEDYSQWYLDVISAAEMVDSSPVKGCMVIRPWGMALWDTFRDDMDRRIKEKDVVNAYFPLFIPRSFLSKEAEHVEGFAKECAVVTHHRLCADPSGSGQLIPDPEAKLEEPLVVRPTSETIIWNMFSKWISSHRDLPLKLNQWANVVRWEMRTRPFLRSAEFLWQEGHTAHATSKEALGCAREMLDVYAAACKDMLAMPVIKGVKSPMERFAGADETFTIEALMQNGWALQSGTSHFLGQNFAKAFDVFFQNQDGDRELVWATSWGVSTRLIGALIMTHSDDLGLKLPPPVAPVQVVIVPITKGKGDDADKKVNQMVDNVTAQLKAVGVRVKVDDRPNTRPGAKYFEWERKGVPVRLEVGPRDVDKGVMVMAKRTGGDKTPVEVTESFGTKILDELKAMHEAMYAAAEERLSARTIPVTSYEEMKAHMSSEDSSRIGFYLAPWHCDRNAEKEVQEDSKATIRCYPLHLNMEVEQGASTADGKVCFYSGRPATHMALFARSY